MWRFNSSDFEGLAGWDVSGANGATVSSAWVVTRLIRRWGVVLGGEGLRSGLAGLLGVCVDGWGLDLQAEERRPRPTRVVVRLGRRRRGGSWRPVGDDPDDVGTPVDSTPLLRVAFGRRRQGRPIVNYDDAIEAVQFPRTEEGL